MIFNVDGVRVIQIIKDWVLTKLLGVNSEVLLWENASPTSTFAGQTITLDLSEYDEIKIFHITNGGGDIRLSSDICRKEYTSMLAYGAFVYNSTGSSRGANGARLATISDTGIVMGNGFKTLISSGVYTTTTDNLACIPYQIYGIKGVA